MHKLLLHLYIGWFWMLLFVMALFLNDNLWSFSWTVTHQASTSWETFIIDSSAIWSHSFVFDIALINKVHFMVSYQSMFVFETPSLERWSSKSNKLLFVRHDCVPLDTQYSTVMERWWWWFFVNRIWSKLIIIKS